jgi:hypothetical protein
VKTSMRLAHAISALGHPLVMIALFVVVVAVRQGPAVLPLRYALLIVAGQIIPVAIWNLRQTRAGRYTNFDVSVRAERMSMYALILVLMVPATIAIQWAPVARDVRTGMLCTTLLFVVSWAVNFRIKLSLHAAVSFYLAVACTMIDVRAGLVLFLSAAAVSISRLILRRHTAAELWLGSVLGIAAGLVLRFAAA